MNSNTTDIASPFIRNLKGAFPFRLGTTSCVLPEGLVENVTFLAPFAEDIELVLFDLPEASNLPDEITVGRLADLKARFDLSYTVHVPMELRLGDADNEKRRRSIQKTIEIIERTAGVDPVAFVLHFDGGRRGRTPADDMEAWTKALDSSISEILGTGIHPELLCIETLDYPFEYIEAIIFGRGLSICLDIGHLLLGGYSIEEYTDRYLQHCRVMHLHGIREGEDHRDIAALPSQILASLLKRLRGDLTLHRVITLEVFSVEDYLNSMEVLGEYVEATK